MASDERVSGERERKQRFIRLELTRTEDRDEPAAEDEPPPPDGLSAALAAARLRRQAL